MSRNADPDGVLTKDSLDLDWSAGKLGLDVLGFFMVSSLDFELPNMHELRPRVSSSMSEIMINGTYRTKTSKLARIRQIII